MQRHQSRHLQCAKREEVEVSVAKGALHVLVDLDEDVVEHLLAASSNVFRGCHRGARRWAPGCGARSSARQPPPASVPSPKSRA
eukprot:6136657-Heterocapsa_arctica.AAC.1